MSTPVTIESLSALLTQLQGSLNALGQRNDELVEENRRLQERVNNPPPITVTFPENFQVQNNSTPIATAPSQTPNVNVPKEFDGSKPSEYRQFLRACEHTFEVQASRYPTERVRIIFALSYLADGPQRYFQTLFEQTNSKLTTWAEFKTRFISAYGDPDIEHTAARKLKDLRQTGSATNYAATFMELASFLDYNDKALKDQFEYGLKQDITDIINHLPAEIVPTEFEKFKDWVIALDKRQYGSKRDSQKNQNQQARNSNGRFAPTSTTTTTTPISNSTPQTGPVPIVVDATSGFPKKLTPEEREKLRSQRACFRCRLAGHMARDCPKGKLGVASIETTPESGNESSQ
jgi:hypothetical protein